MDKTILVSMLIIVRNAESYIVKSIDSLINQGLKKDEYEIIIVDGLSSDNTIKIAKKYLEKNNINYRILENNKKTLASGWNIGLKASKGEYVVRPDAHAELLEGYVKTAINKLQQDKSLMAVGGILITKSSKYMGNMIAKVLSNPIGVGSSLFRIGVKKDTYSDTAVYAVYKKRIFEEIGFFDESLERNQDINLHLRILQKDYKILTSPDMKAVYYNRTTLKKFILQAYQNGFWVTYGKSGHLRHMIPMLFLFSIIVSLFSKILQLILYPLYFIVILFAYILKSKEYNPINLLVLLILTFTLHISYGFGSLVGLIKRFWRKK